MDIPEVRRKGQPDSGSEAPAASSSLSKTPRKKRGWGGFTPRRGAAITPRGLLGGRTPRSLSRDANATPSSRSAAQAAILAQQAVKVRAPMRLWDVAR